MKFSLAAVAITAGFIASVDARTRNVNDACGLASNSIADQKYYVDSKLAVKCLDSVPFDQKVSDSIAETLINTLNEYAFLDIAKKSPTPEFPMKNDMVARIKAINQKTFINDRELQAAYKQVFTDAHDAHTLYYPACMSVYRFLQPFDIHTIIENGKQVVKVGNVIRDGDPELVDIWLNAFPDLAPSELRNYTIASMNGKSPLVYIKNLAHHSIGTYKDFQTRFNKASGSVSYDGKGKTSYDFGHSQVRIDPPRKLSISYKLIAPDGTQLRVVYPWVAIQPRTLYKDLNSFKSTFCQPSILDFMNQSEEIEAMETRKGPLPLINSMGENNQLILTPTEFVNENFEKPIKFRVNNRIGINSANYEDGDTVAGSLDGVYPIPVLEGLFAGFYMATENVGVAWIPSFAPSGDCTIKGKEDLLKEVSANFRGFFCFIDEISRGYRALKKQGAKRLIIDFSGNGGGYVTLGTIHNKILFGKDVPLTARDYRLSPLVKELFKRGFRSRYNTSFGKDNFLSVNGTEFEHIDDFLSGSRIIERGGAESEYSQKVIYNEGLEENDESNPLFVLGVKLLKRPIFDAKDILILTDGGCGSTCAQTTLQLNGLFGVKAVVKGGVNRQKPFSFSSFPGGNVIDYRQIFSEIKALGAQHRPDAPIAPVNYKILALRVDFSETYSFINPEIPAEFDFVPGVKKYDIDTDKFWPPAVWKEVASSFKIRKRNTRKSTQTASHRSRLQSSMSGSRATRIFSKGGLPDAYFPQVEQADELLEDLELADEDSDIELEFDTELEQNVRHSDFYF